MSGAFKIPDPSRPSRSPRLMLEAHEVGKPIVDEHGELLPEFDHRETIPLASHKT